MQDPGILIVIVVYNTSFESSKTFLSMSESVIKLGQKIDLVVYDNNPSGKATSDDDYDFWNIIYIPDKNNNGVSRAYNVAAGIAKKMSKNWLLLLDEDTEFPADAISSYFAAIADHPNEKLFTPIMLTQAGDIISPCKFKFMRGYYADRIDPGLNSLKGKSVINCGTCVHLDTFNQLNGYNELIKLDFSDHDFIRRFKEGITSDFVVIDLQVQHGLSTTEKRTFDSDAIRFAYYLEGCRHFSKSLGDTFFLKLNAALRGLKLTVNHGKLYFLGRVINYLFS